MLHLLLEAAQPEVRPSVVTWVAIDVVDVDADRRPLPSHVEKRQAVRETFLAVHRYPDVAVWGEGARPSSAVLDQVEIPGLGVIRDDLFEEFLGEVFGIHARTTLGRHIAAVQ